MTHGSLFSGIGGFDLAAEWVGWDNKFHCEWSKFNQTILKYHFPKAESYGDISKTDFTIWRGGIDVLTGGFPCQPYSQAGKRRGKDDPRHLWPEMLRVIREIRPKWIVGENVYGLINWNGGLVFDEIKADLANEGYQVIPVVLPACGVNAPHRRYRIWFVTYASSDGLESRGFREDRSETRESQTDEQQWERIREDIGGISEQDVTPNPQSQQGERFEFKQPEFSQSKQGEFGGSGSEMDDIASNPSNQRLQGSKNNGSIGGSRENGNKQPAGFFQPTWQNFPTQSPICRGDDGLSDLLDVATVFEATGKKRGNHYGQWRNESIKAYGNAIVPQIAYQIFKVIDRL